MTETEFTCAVCGKEGTVPFVPKNPDSLFCRECQTLYKEAQKDKERAARKKIPRKAHNTRVSFPITCAECGKYEVLDYRPKGVPLSEVCCRECTAKKAGEDSRYVERVRQIENETTRQIYPVACDTCGIEIRLTRKPWPGREYECDSCQKGYERAGEGVKAGAEVVDGTLGMVRKRSKKSD